MDEEEKRTLKALGYSDEILEFLSRPRTPAMEAVDRMFLDNAKAALEQVGCTALEFMEEHPGLDVVELAKCLNRGASGIGMAMVIYEEAEQTGRTRQVAQELLFRKIITRFPDGWFEEPTVHSGVKLGMWDSDIEKYASDSSAAYATAVWRELTINNPPPEGWKPANANDERLQSIFDKCWPNNK